MKRTVYVICFILIISGFSMTSIGKEQKQGNIIYVDDDGGADYTTIQGAIDTANEGDIIHVYNGIYYENIVIDKSLILQGENKVTTKIIADEATVKIISDNVEFSGFTVESLEQWGDMIELDSNYNSIHDNILINEGLTGHLFITGDNNDILNNQIVGGIWLRRGNINNISHNNVSVIWLSNSNNNKISYNDISYEQDTGIHIQDSERNTVEYNIIKNNSIGIVIVGSDRIIIRYNDFINNNENAEIAWKDHYIWFHNYWGASDEEFSFNWFIPLPYPIMGMTYYGLMLNFDWFPAIRPNNYTRE